MLIVGKCVNNRVSLTLLINIHQDCFEKPAFVRMWVFCAKSIRECFIILFTINVS